jgi:hypothetical protein
MDYKSFEEKELQILRNAVDEAGEIMGKKLAQSEDIKKLISLLEHYLRTHKILCYGGTAINNILPEQFRFYNKDVEIPDYDFFTSNAFEDAKKIADIFYKEGYKEVEAKSGVHSGTYKVFVNFIPMADITQLDYQLFNNLYKNCIKVNGIAYCPPNFLRMAMYQELSRPMGDVSRWEKVLKRLILLNKNYPLKGQQCSKQNFQRTYEGPIEERNSIYEISKQNFINQGLIFFGGYAASLYGKYMPYKEKKIINSIPDFDILSEEPEQSATILKEQLNYEGFNNIKINKKSAIGEYVDEHYEVVVNKDTIAIIYKAQACHSYNIIYIDNQKIKVASIDTMLYFYLIFIYADRSYFDENRLLCMSEYLFKVQLKNRLKQKGLLKRFSVNCFGKQKTLEDIRAAKAKKFNELIEKGIKKGTKEYEIHFLRYVPYEIDKKKLEFRENKNQMKKTKKQKLKHKHKYKHKHKEKEKQKLKRMKTNKRR